MLRQILEANNGLPDRAKVIFSNTGREMPQTLDFVQEVSDRWSVPITWVEYRPEKPLFAVVNHNSAARDGEPFEDMIKKYSVGRYLPNQQMRYCTQELKVRVAKRFLVSVGWKNWMAGIGIRADEPRRVRREKQKERWQRWYPLADAGVSKADIAAFWGAQPFDLRLQTINGKAALGNCDGCFLKSEAHLAMLARDHAERHAWWERMEEMVQENTNGAGGQWRKNFSRRELREFVERQGDWIFDQDGALCQADDGECTG